MRPLARMAWLAIMAAAVLYVNVPAHAVTVTIDGKANIFGAGHASPPAPGGGGAGLRPTLVSLPTGASIVTFSSVTGIVSCCGGAGANGPDGGTAASGTTDITSFDGISGILHSDRTMFLTGVFVGPSEPSDPAPARLSFSTAGGGGTIATSFFDIFVELDQTFFVGDGLTGTGSGTTQQFHVPAGATRLYLGFADAFEFGNPTSAPGFYGDNTGSLTATVNVAVPLPGTLVLLLAGLGAVVGASRRRRRDDTA